MQNQSERTVGCSGQYNGPPCDIFDNEMVDDPNPSGFALYSKICCCGNGNDLATAKKRSVTSMSATMISGETITERSLLREPNVICSGETNDDSNGFLGERGE